MRIVINIGCLAKDEWGSFEYYTNALVQGLVQMNPQHEFLFFSDKSLTHFHIDAKTIVLPPLIKGNTSLKYWYDIKLSRATKKLNAAIIINFGNICSLTSKIPQVLVVKDLAFVHQPASFSKSGLLFHRIFQKRFMVKAKHIVTPSASVKQEIVDQYKISAEKITAILPAAHKNSSRIQFEQRQTIKDGYAEGREYFLFIGGTQPQNNLMNVLKAFSILKKWQQSSMKLLVTGEIDPGFMIKLNTYKYRDDVAMLGYLPDDQYARLMAAAYALVYTSIYKGIGLPLVEAMQLAVPIITSNKSAFSEIVGGAVLYTDPNEVDEIADQLKTLYRDETLRGQLIQKGQVQAKKFSWEQSSEKLMEIIEATASK